MLFNYIDYIILIIYSYLIYVIIILFACVPRVYLNVTRT